MIIPGLTYVPNFISSDEEDSLLLQIDTQPWLTDLKRRVQHYGYKYDYKSRSIDSSMELGPLPLWASDLSDKLLSVTSEKPDQVIVNEYLPGQGINNHIDCVPCFTSKIISLSLGSDCVMNLTNTWGEEKEVVPILLERRSLLILEGKARYLWMHGIPARKTDQIGDRVIERTRRVSLTFRKVILTP
jgi:alkylated DNA repair dioxygenase AlkB